MLRRLTRSVALAFVCAASSIAIAQVPKPVYVQYEGFVKNPDRTLTLVFSYFNMNDAAVLVPAGERNSFTPAPADRGQPTRFEAGRHRFACVMVEPEGFDGNIRWRLQSGDQSTLSITTARVLDTNYALEDRSAAAAVKGLDIRALAQGRCGAPKP
jgi:hypothetical protein